MSGRLIVLALALAITGCAGLDPIDQRPESPLMHPAAEAHYEVREGDTLYSIAFRHGVDYQELARWNGIHPPYAIYPGQKLRVRPGGEHVAATRLESPDRGSRAHKERTTDAGAMPDEAPERSGPEEPQSDGPADASTDGTEPAWMWPADGELVRDYDPEQNGHRGIRIRGNEGDRIRAAADGTVVYSGSGLIGYGNLIIIKHDGDFLSAYGHNRELRVEEGESIEQGAHIADMGRAGNDGSLLHFEIREQGRPVNPVDVLPAR